MYLIKCICFIFLIKLVSCARILGFVPSPSYSHQIVFQPIWKEISLRGHELVILTCDPMKEKHNANLKEIDLSSTYDFINNYNITEIYNGKFNFLKTFQLMRRIGYDMVDYQLQLPDVQSLLNNKTEHFDVILAESIVPQMFAFKYRFNCPLIGLVSLGLDFRGHISIGNPFHPITNPSHFLPIFSNLSFSERMLSTLFRVGFKLWLDFTDSNEDPLIKKHFGEGNPTFHEMASDVDMIFANTNPVFKVLQPTVPALVEFGGGIHIKPPKPLPEDLKKYLDNSKRGVIFFSLGSNVKSASIPENTKEAILKTFTDLPYDILWKFEDTHLPNQPKNVKILPWVPQMDVLRHPNIKLFISQCGIQSLEEALYANVPVVGMPFFVDQPYNARMVEDIGIGLYVPSNNLEKDTFEKAINAVITDPKYKNKITELAKLSKDVPMSGLEKVVFWTEYVIRHKGAKHLRVASLDVPFYQYYMIDIIGTMLFIVGVVLYIFFFIIKRIIRKSRKRKIE